MLGNGTSLPQTKSSNFPTVHKVVLNKSENVSGNTILGPSSGHQAFILILPYEQVIYCSVTT